MLGCLRKILNFVAMPASLLIPTMRKTLLMGFTDPTPIFIPDVKLRATNSTLRETLIKKTSKEPKFLLGKN